MCNSRSRYRCGDVARYAAEAQHIGASIDRMKDPHSALWLAASHVGNLPDVWGTAYLVQLNLSTAVRVSVLLAGKSPI